MKGGSSGREDRSRAAVGLRLGGGCLCKGVSQPECILNVTHEVDPALERRTDAADC